MSIRVGIVGISGFGGGEAMRLIASHPSFELIYAAGEGSAGSRLVDRFPAATLSALAPLLANRLIEPGNIVIDAKTGISGAGRGGADSTGASEYEGKAR